ncbi:MAG: HlyD family secretion protein, partial [Polaromonas sp.]|nr:HlyD family secretion protein [Polaromonas sp.]
TLPQQAVTRTAQGDTVMVVGSDGKVVSRPVKIGSAKGAQWVVLDGLAAGDQVMVDGFQKLQMMPPGTPVKPVPWQPAGSAASAPVAIGAAPAASTAAAPAASAAAQ